MKRRLNRILANSIYSRLKHSNPDYEMLVDEFEDYAENANPSEIARNIIKYFSPDEFEDFMQVVYPDLLDSIDELRRIRGM